MSRNSIIHVNDLKKKFKVMSIIQKIVKCSGPSLKKKVKAHKI